MKKVYMQNSHAPASNEWGDCLRACVCSLFELEPEDVPHFGEGGPDAIEMWRRVDEWAGRMRMRSWGIVFNGSDDLDNVLTVVNTLNRDAFYLVGGTTNAGGDHIVVAYGDKIIHDPSRMGSGIQGPASDGFYHIITFRARFQMIAYAGIGSRETPHAVRMEMAQWGWYLKPKPGSYCGLAVRGVLIKRLRQR